MCFVALMSGDHHHVDTMKLTVISNLPVELKNSTAFPLFLSFSPSQLFFFSAVVYALFDVGGRRALVLF